MNCRNEIKTKTHFNLFPFVNLVLMYGMTHGNICFVVSTIIAGNTNLPYAFLKGEQIQVESNIKVSFGNTNYAFFLYPHTKAIPMR